MKSEYPGAWLLLGMLTVPALLCASYSRGVLLGREQVRQFNISYLIDDTARFLLIIFFVLVLKWGVFGALLAVLLANGASAGYALMIAAQRRLWRFSLKSSILRELFGLGIQYSVGLFVLQLNYRADMVFLERLSSSSELGLYTVAKPITELLWQFPLSLGIIVFSRSANAKDTEAFAQKTAEVMRITFPLALASAVVLAAVVPLLVRVAYGIDFVGAIPVILVMIPGVTLFSFVKVLHSEMAGRGRPLLAAKVMLPALIVNLMLNRLWIPQWGAGGASLASTISYTIGAAMYICVYAQQSSVSIRDIVVPRRTDALRIWGEGIRVWRHVRKCLFWCGAR